MLNDQKGYVKEMAKSKKGKNKEMEIARKGNAWKHATACVGVI